MKTTGRPLTLADQFIDGLAAELGDNLCQLFIVNFDTDTAEDLAKVVLRWGLVSTEGSQKVGGNVTHV